MTIVFFQAKGDSKIKSAAFSNYLPALIKTNLKNKLIQLLKNEFFHFLDLCGNVERFFYQDGMPTKLTPKISRTE